MADSQHEQAMCPQCNHGRVYGIYCWKHDEKLQRQASAQLGEKKVNLTTNLTTTTTEELESRAHNLNHALKDAETVVQNLKRELGNFENHWATLILEQTELRRELRRRYGNV